MSSSVGMILPNIWKNKIHVPNHQPDFIVYPIYLYLLGVLNPDTSLGGAPTSYQTSANLNHAIPPDRSIQRTQSQRHCIGPDLYDGELGGNWAKLGPQLVWMSLLTLNQDGDLEPWRGCNAFFFWTTSCEFGAMLKRIGPTRPYQLSERTGDLKGW